MRPASLAILGGPETVHVVTHRGMLEHRTGDHDEIPERLAAAWSGIDDAARRGVPLVRLEARPASDAELRAVHGAQYLAELQRACASGTGWISTPDCPISPGTWQAATLAAGAGALAAEEVLAGRCHRCFCAVRPPGHHAHATRAGGFCYLNNVVIACRKLLDGGIARVVVVDLDFHHGDGTEALLAGDPRCAYLSLHGDPANTFPGTGHATDSDRVVDEPLPRPAGDARWLAALRSGLDRLAAFPAEVVLLSFGTDALHGDPVGDLGIGQRTLASGAREVLERWPRAPSISLLEGGYDLDALREGVGGHLAALAEVRVRAR